MRRDRGASSLEYIGAIMLTVLLVGSVSVALTGNGGKVRTVLCKAVNQILLSDGTCGDTTTAEPPDNEPFKPEQCKVNEKGEKVSSKVKVLFISFGEDAGFVVTEYSDGTVKMTATDGGSLGATGGFGADASYGDMGLGAKVDFGGGVKFEKGSTWTFKNMDEANAMKKQLDDYLMYKAREKAATTSGNPGSALYFYLFVDEVKPPKPPSETTSSIATYAEVGSRLGIDLTPGGPKGTDTKIPAAEVVSKITGESKWAVRTNTATGATTYTTQLQLSSDVAANIWMDQFGVKGTGTGAMSITKDKDGNITNITFLSTAEGGVKSGEGTNGEISKGSGDDKQSGKGSVSASTDSTTASVVTTSVDIDPKSASEQQIVRDWLGGNSNYSWAGAMSADNFNPSKPVPGDDFQNLLYNKAQVSAVSYDKITDKFQFGLNVKLGFALGFDFSMEKSESNAVAAAYLGAPNGGSRPALDFPECVK